MTNTVITTFVNNIKNNKYDEAVNLAYDNIDYIKTKIKDFGFKIQDKSDKDLINITNKYTLDTCVDELSCFRTGVLTLVDRFKNMALKEREEVLSHRTNITYIVAIADDEIKTKLFMLYLLVYYLESRIRRYKLGEHKGDELTDLNSKPHVGIDYEFNNRLIALMQINFETISDKSSSTNSYIWIVNPGEFDSSQNKILIKYLMTNQDIYKILHGADSLDIPYMYGTMFNNDKEVIKAFTRKVIDTRFLCEYLKLSIEKDKKCSIYEAIKYFGTISQQKYDELNKVHDSMGPVQDISWSIHKMSSFHIKYGLYDVLFLQHFLLDIYAKIKKETPKLVPSYKFINPIVRFIYLERNGITTIIEEAKDVVNPLNNYLFKVNDKNITLITAFNTIIQNFKILIEDDDYIDFDFLLIVGYFRKTLLVVLKKIVYYLIRDKFKVYKNKLETMSEPINIDATYKQLEKEGYVQILRLFKLFESEAKKKIALIYR